jgi:cytoplasmic iron level regulating protein YaaA (DUF328/UPF0246 family)
MNWQFKLEEPIVNLASLEYSKALNQPMISIEFYENDNGKLINKATYAKMARGSMLDYCITNKISVPKQLTSFNQLGYKYSENHSTKSLYVFIRDEKRPNK